MIHSAMLLLKANWQQASAFLLICMATHIQAAPLGATQVKGCTSAKVALRSGQPVDNSNAKAVHLLADLDMLSKGIKRSVEDTVDCESERGTKKHSVAIKQLSVGSIPKSKVAKVTLKADTARKKATVNTPTFLNKTKGSGLTEIASKVNSTAPLNSSKNKTLNATKPETAALSHIVKDVNATKRGLLHKPNLKALKDSPLWSLSKLIDDAEKGSKKSAKNITTDYHSIVPSDEAIKGYNEKNETNGVQKATVAGKSSSFSAPLPSSKGEPKVLSSKVSDVKGGNIKSSATDGKTVAHAGAVASSAKAPAANAPPPPPPDPYAEIAEGPDKPKLPDLKTDDESGAPLMKFGGKGDVEQLAGALGNAKGSKPLEGQHDVGGLLDSLTDKLNAGGGVATDQPLPQNEVKYLQGQSSMLEDEAEKQTDRWSGLDKLKETADQLESASEAKKIGDVEENEKTISPLNNAAGAAAETGAGVPPAPTSAALEPNDEPPADGGMPGGVTKTMLSKFAENEAGLEQMLSEKAGGLNTIGSMAQLTKPSAKPEGDELSEFAGADVTPGPDPYSQQDPSALRSEAEEGQEPVGTAANYGALAQGLSSQDSASESLSALKDRLTAGGGGSMERYNSLDAVPAGYEPTAQSSMPGLEQAQDMMAETRSPQGRSYLDAAMAAVDNRGMELTNTRTHIPAELMSGARDIEQDSVAFQDNSDMNRALFQRSMILRPEPDEYTSPYIDVEDYENDD